MEVTLEGECRVADMHDGEPLAAGTLRIWNQIGRTTGAEAISLRILEFAPGLSPAIRNSDCDEILYVLDSALGMEREPAGSPAGQPRWRARPVRLSEQTDTAGASAAILINGRAHDIGPDTGIYIRPNEIFAIDNPGPDPVVLISSRCPEPDGAPEFIARSTSTSSSPKHSPLVRLADRPTQPTADRWYRVLVDDQIGSTQATQFVGSIPPGRAPDHFHHYEEVLFILKGSGRMWAGETNTPIAPGSCIYLPKEQIHCVENTGEGELRLLGVFYPAGSPSVRYDV
jgi:mannose-6-phosphate isomerase-like protein (cupin superfamily)